MHLLSDEQLFDSYKKAMELNLDKEFIQLLEEEIKKRNICIEIG
ncbi:sporulation histidine kinase inhibitor Sda [Gracilibacillus salitolerans]|uniref:Sporulation histidine kinase inhibitor Sda n=1 Tax=Gracilibacillus salitolerans TaxID=2663022 RepID=A0A5Q2TIE5_9BACI|nr:sporulation histidine kinase inhibitor Sda [Gracilibacillus salitolerans]QGH34465.1 sporulation histidine kinase inhibitor Sda [Gracilibacillus salitolerans]